MKSNTMPAPTAGMSGKTADKDAAPLVSIVMASYNNVQYLEQAVHSCLCQKTDFAFRLIISDDCSTDGSQELIQDLAAKHPNIHVIQQAKNAIYKNYTDMLNAVRTKYVAFCDGDDFWLDENKLALQVEFLEKHPDFTVCAHKTDVWLEGYSGPDAPKPIYKRDPSKRTQESGVLYADEIADNYYLHTSSYVFRWLFPGGLPSYWEHFMTNDHFLLLLHAAEGKIKYFDRTLSVWRRHNNGYTWLQTKKPSAYIREKWDQFIELQIKMDAFFEGRFRYQLLERVRFALQGVMKECLAVGDLAMLHFVVKRYDKYFEEFENKYGEILDGLRLARRVIDPEAAFVRLDALTPPPGVAEPQEAAPIPVGGPVPLDLDSVPIPADNVWAAWTDGKEYACFQNAESALAALLWQQGRHIWLPYFHAPFFKTLIQHAELLCSFYDTGDDLSYSPNFLNALQAGDVVVTPCYFGRPLPVEMHRALADRPDLIWIEDRSYALDVWDSPAHWVLYSPSTILGVPDGGIILGQGLSSWLPQPPEKNEERAVRRLSPALLNYEFPGRSFTAARLSPEKEPYIEIGRVAMSRTSRALLERLPIAAISEARKRNWSVLYRRLAEFALWDIPVPCFTPSAFPLMLPKGQAACRLASFLADAGFLCPVPYSIARAYVRSEALFVRLGALPCSHNYTEADMERLASETLRILKS